MVILGKELQQLIVSSSSDYLLPPSSPPPASSWNIEPNSIEVVITGGLRILDNFPGPITMSNFKILSLGSRLSYHDGSESHFGEVVSQDQFSAHVFSYPELANDGGCLYRCPKDRVQNEEMTTNAISDVYEDRGLFRLILGPMNNPSFK
ncbi:unnamed protein product [Mesocestoides corti]|uniref:TFIIIC_sub6 domain-containing protein n=1 Tax=Mesocestoides corti TaxID=53468 RepID=A0A0R3UAZ2_MESCO|nr:unnamed protein product [Mesocestoides corti]